MLFPKDGEDIKIPVKWLQGEDGKYDILGEQYNKISLVELVDDYWLFYQGGSAVYIPSTDMEYNLP